ncbi:MAG: hypothetical protein V4482_03995 [Pseudomonadota bacterium]
MNDGFLTQLGGLFLHKVECVVEHEIERDLESGMFEGGAQIERLINKAPDEVARGLNVMIDGKLYIEASRMHERMKHLENQVTYVSYAFSVLKKCGKGDRKAIVIVVLSLLTTHGFVRLFI